MTQTQRARPRAAADVVIDLAAVPPEAEEDARDMERYTAERDAGQLAEDDFRRFRLNNGIYGIRHRELIHMVRVKVPQGKLTPESARVLAKIGADFSRGFGHITTRQCFQFHMVPIGDVPTVMRWLSTVGLTTREACGDTARNIQGDHLAGIGPDQLFDVTPWARYMTDHFLRNPAFQRFPRKFKMNFSGSDADLGQALINDIGAIAAKHPTTGDPGFKIFVGGGLGTTPHEAKRLEEFTSMENVVPTFDAIARVFDRTGNRENRNRARLKWVLDTFGIEKFRELVFAERRAVIAVHGVNTGIPEEIIAVGAHLPFERRPLTPLPQPNGNARLNRWVQTNVVPTHDGRFAVYVTTPLGDIDVPQFLALADIMEDYGDPEGGCADVRTTNRQNLCFRGVEPERVTELWQRLEEIGLGDPDAHTAGDPVACPGADTCNLAITQSRGLAKAIRHTFAGEGIGDAPVKVNISGCSNSCGQHHLADIGFFGLERRAGGHSAPGYQLMVGGGLVPDGTHFGTKVAKVGAKQAPEAAARLIQEWQSRRADGESFRDWSDRLGRNGLADIVGDLAEVQTYDASPDSYVDWDELMPFEVNLGQGECA